MARTPSTMVPLGTPAPDFSLFNPETGQSMGLSDISGGKALLVMFICNHCPYVIHIKHVFPELMKRYGSKGLRVVAINANDALNYPQDGPDHMAELVRDEAWGFPFLFDASQATARAYNAACTPDFFLYDAELELVYRGQLDGSRPGSDIPVTGADLYPAIEATLEGEAVAQAQTPSIGCNIKWLSGNEPT